MKGTVLPAACPMRAGPRWQAGVRSRFRRGARRRGRRSGVRRGRAWVRCVPWVIFLSWWIRDAGSPEAANDGEEEGPFELLASSSGTAVRRGSRTRLRVVGASPAWAARWPAVGKVLPSPSPTSIRILASVLTPTSGIEFRTSVREEGGTPGVPRSVRPPACAGRGLRSGTVVRDPARFGWAVPARSARTGGVDGRGRGGGRWWAVVDSHRSCGVWRVDTVRYEGVCMRPRGTPAADHPAFASLQEHPS